MFRAWKLGVAIILFTACTLAIAQSNNTDLDRAMQGDPAAQLRLAKAYHTGEGQPRDIREAVRWYQAAAAKGNPEAAYSLGMLAYNGDMLGDRIAQSDVAAWIWFSIAANAGYSDATDAVSRMEAELPQFRLLEAHERLASMYITGNMIPANAFAAANELQWLEKHESGQGTLLLGRAYLLGRGIAKDIDKAQALCEKAAKNHVEGANYCLGEVFDTRGDTKAGFEAIKRDADRGYPAAMIAIIDRYHDGKGTSPDPVLAYAWALQSSRGGIVEAVAKRDLIASELNDKQKKDAEKKAAKLINPAAPAGIRYAPPK